MPKPSDGESEKDFVERCIPMVIDDGTAKDGKQAFAVCTSMFGEAQKAVKLGARNSARDGERLQQIHDLSAQNGAVCAPAPEVTSQPISKIVDPDDTLINYGSSVKVLATSDGKTKVGGYLVTFTDAQRPDKSPSHDYFDKDTDFAITFPGKSLSWCNHRFPINTSKGLRMLDGNLEPIELTLDEIGVFGTGLLDERNEYEKLLLDLARENKLGFSSGTAGHLIKATAQPNGTNHIDLWPLGLDASYTHMPAEPQNKVIPLKSLSVDNTPNEPTGKAEGAGDAPPNPKESEAKSIKSLEVKMDEKELQAFAKTVADEAVKSFIAAQPVVNSPGVQVVKDAGDQPWGSPGKFFQAVKTAAITPHAIDPRLAKMEVKVSGMNEAVPSQGGFLVTTEVAPGLFENLSPIGTLLAQYKKDPVAGNTITLNQVDETSHANGSRWGGITSYWLQEGGTIAASYPKFRQTVASLKGVAALVYATDEQLEDVPYLGSWLTRTVPQELRFRVEDALVNGDGVGKPKGLLNAACVKSVGRYTASLIAAVDVANMWAGRYVGLNDYIWLTSQNTISQFLSMTIGSYFPAYMPPGGLANLPTPQILGKPVFETEYNPALGTTGDLVLFSPSCYAFIEKASGIQSASSIHVAFATNEQAFRFNYRCDARPLWYSTLTLKNSLTVSPIVVLSSSTG
jgi:HK97 family phage major capsid protein